jgi:hypothetical protein
MPCKAKFRGIQRNSAAFRDTEFRIIPRNFRQFRMTYGIYGSKKNVRNSVLTEFRGLPSNKHLSGCLMRQILTAVLLKQIHDLCYKL